MPTSRAPHPRTAPRLALRGLQAALASLAIAGCSDGRAEPLARPDSRDEYRRPREVPAPADNRGTPARVTLGRMLFFDPRLSRSRTVSCASCHNPSFGWSDGLATAVGDQMKTLPRRTPTVQNLAWAEALFWDGRAGTLEEQALGPIQATGEMNLPLDSMVARLRDIPGYAPLARAAYPGEPLSPQLVARAVAAYERTLVTARAPFDRWVDGDENAISAEAKLGFRLFNGRARCAQCHTGWRFTDDGFHDIGVAGDDRGRGGVVELAEAQHAFKTPTLRNVAIRSPYMHNGSERTLEQVIELYDRGGRVQRSTLDPEMQPLHLTPAERRALLVFLGTLTSADPPVELPRLPR